MLPLQERTSVIVLLGTKICIHQTYLPARAHVPSTRSKFDLIKISCFSATSGKKRNCGKLHPFAYVTF